MDKRSISELVLRRRELLAGAAIFLLGIPPGSASPIPHRLPWAPNAGDPPMPAMPGPWLFFTGAEGRAMEAIADRIIPPDPQTPGGKDAGCAVFVDRQLAGPYGRQDGLYLRPPFQAGAKNQGAQSADGPARKYREALAALDRACNSRYAGKTFADLSDSDKDTVLKGLESGDVKLEGADGQSFFEQAVKDVQMGFFADPIYGGNRDMVGWRMIGYPGARYNYLDWVSRHNERFPLPPVSITGRAEWTRKHVEADHGAPTPKKDVVIIGLGWTGSIMAHELTDEGLDVMAIERGPWRDAPTDFPPGYMQDELRYRIRHELFLRPEQTTFTFRNRMDQTALPIRSWGAFMPPNGVGGGGVHWNAETWRFLPSDFVLRTHLTQRYGASFLPADMTIQDWGVTYQDLEPHYDQFEYLCGTSGTAGNLRGEIQEGGNPFEGPRSRPYPNPAQVQPFSHTLFGKAARELGYKPFPQPSGNLSKAYTNPLGLRLGPCTYCGFCEWFGCGNYSKASPQTTILPALLRKANFSVRDNSEVTRINTEKSGKRATGVTFVDTSGEEWEQPADLVILSAFSLFNVQLLLLSKIGQPYDPVANTGVIGRNYTHQTISSANGFFDKAKFNFNPFIGSGSIGMCIDEFNGDNFDHGPHGFVGGGYVGQVQTGARPIESALTPPGTPKWGAAWKTAVRDNYLSTVKPGTGVHGSFYAYRDVYLDIDPTYKDRFGRPLMRMTIDLHENEVKQNRFLTDKFAEVIKAMGANQVVKQYRTAPYNITEYQTTHVNGGAVMGADPRTSAVNRYLQSWDVSNLFVLGASAFPQNAGYNPTGTVAALAFWAASAIRNQYLKNPGRLVDA